MTLKWALNALLAISISQLSAQVIDGVVVDPDNQAIPFANIILKRVGESALYRGTNTEKDGSFVLNGLASGNYELTISLLGYEDLRLPAFSLGPGEQKQLGRLTMVEGIALDEVVVETTKPLFEQKSDRTIINVSSSIVSSGTTALQILERSPGVVVDRQNGNLAIFGKSGVQVMINGKISYMPAASIIQLLEGTASDNIETIEIITTPPASLDAEGNAGYINIVMKQRSDLGFNGSYSLSAGVGNGTITSNNVNFNYRKDRLNLFASYSFLRQEQGQVVTADRQVDEPAGLFELSSYSTRDPTQRNHNVRLGLDYEPDDRSFFGLIVTAYDQKWEMDAFNATQELLDGNLQTRLETPNTERNQWKNFGSNLNYRWSPVDNESLSFDLDYLRYDNENPSDYLNRSFDAADNLVGEEEIRIRKVTPIDIFVARADYRKQWPSGNSLEFGAKSVNSRFTNDFKVETEVDEVVVQDSALSNRSDLDERILAAYLSSELQLTKKTRATLGLRYEYTNSKLDVNREFTAVDRQFGRFFPTVNLNHTLNDSLRLNFSYTRRITRPTFNNLAPYAILIDPNTLITGNPALQPDLSDAVKLDFIYKDWILSAQYTVIDEPINNFQPILDSDTGQLILTPVNNEANRIVNLSLSAPLVLTHWWKWQNSVVYTYNELEERVDDLRSMVFLHTVSVNHSQNMTLSKNLSAEVNGFYTSPYLLGLLEVEGYFGINAGVQWRLGNTGGNLKFSFNDIFNDIELRTRAVIPEDNLIFSQRIDLSNTTFLVTYTRNFGNQKLKQQRQRSLGSEEERGRVQD